VFKKHLDTVQDYWRGLEATHAQDITNAFLNKFYFTGPFIPESKLDL
jgi:hypothetical protein